METNRGFTLIEVLVAMVVLGVGLLGMWKMQIGAVQGNSKSYFDTRAMFDGTNEIEIWMGRKYNHLDLTDSNNNGTNQDANWDGVDDNGGNYGLNDFPGCNQVPASLLPGCTNQPADHTLTEPDGTVIYWNVAIDYPVEYTKTVRVHIIRPMAGNTPISLEYIKSEGI